MDRRSRKKALNQEKSAREAEQGPVRKDQANAPIADAMAAYWKRDQLSFSIPAHGGVRGPRPEFAKWAGLDAARADVPMSHGLDTRDRAWQVQATGQELFAEIVREEQTLFSLHGPH